MMKTNWCEDGRGWNRMSAGVGGDGFEVCWDGFGWNQNLIPVQISIVCALQDNGNPQNY